MPGPNARDLLCKRLTNYWRLELANAVLLPLIMVFVTAQVGSDLGWLSWFAFVPMCGLLIVGGLYWRGKLQQIERRSDASLQGALALADRLDWLLLILSAIAVCVAAASWLVPGLSVSLSDRVVATIAATLAVLEYVNYYHRQLQHFDHWPDLKRLMAGKGFGRAQMAVDLDRYRNKKL